jgi:hypothetical protein
LQETIAQALAQEGNRTILFKLFSHYLALSKESDVYAFYLPLYINDEYEYKELEHILKDPSRLKRFIDDCAKDDFCASSDIYDHYYSVYQSLPDENKTAIEQSVTMQDREKTEAKSCGFFASLRKLFTCG